MTNKQVAALLLALAGCSGSNGSDRAAAKPVALVALGRAETRPVTQSVTVYGAVEAGASGRHVLTAPVEAVVARIDAPVGTAVRRGQVVAHLAPSPTTRLDLAKAAADARAAEQAYARARRLHADGLASNAEVETARAAAEAATATRASLAGRSGALALKTPAAGYVETVSANPGDLVALGAAVSTVAGLSDMRARFGVDPALARKLNPGAPVHILPSGGGAPFTVPIGSVDPVVDPQTRLASIFTAVPRPAHLGPGEALTAEVAVGISGNALTIPYAALLDDGGQPYVFVVAKGVAHRHDVRLGPISGDRVAIEQGLHAGDVVVTRGGTALDDGMRVRTR